MYKLLCLKFIFDVLLEVHFSCIISLILGAQFIVDIRAIARAIATVTISIGILAIIFLQIIAIAAIGALLVRFTTSECDHMIFQTIIVRFIKIAGILREYIIYMYVIIFFEVSIVLPLDQSVC